jgi:hypothetical protein
LVACGVSGLSRWRDRSKLHRGGTRARPVCGCDARPQNVEYPSFSYEHLRRRRGSSAALNLALFIYTATNMRAGTVTFVASLGSLRSFGTFAVAGPKQAAPRRNSSEAPVWLRRSPSERRVPKFLVRASSWLFWLQRGGSVWCRETARKKQLAAVTGPGLQFGVLDLLG